MTGTLRLTAAALALAVAAAPRAHAVAPPAPVSEQQVADRLLAALARANGVPGLGAAVVVDGTVVWRGSTGMRDVDAGLPVDRHTVFRLASVSKLLTATAAARLAERGRLDLDASVQSTLPWLATDWASLTPRQLAAHASGLPHYQAADEGRGATHYATVRDAVGVFQGRPLLTPPGRAYQYSSWGYTLLSAVVEAGADRPFLDYLARDVAPGLAIGPDATDTSNPNATKAYGFVDGRAEHLPAHDFSYTWGGGGLGATPEAIAVFGSRVMAGKVVSPATFASMLQPFRLADGAVAGERDFEVGLGWRTSQGLDGERIAHHAGVTGGARSALVLWPTRRISASILSNASWTASIERTAEMLAAPFDRAARNRDRDRDRTTACPVNATAYEADYEGARFQGTATFTNANGHCTGRITLPDGALRAWLADFPQRDAEALEIIGLQSGAGIGRAALVTPIGLHELRADTDGRTWRVRFGATRTLVLRWTPQAAN